MKEKGKNISLIVINAILVIALIIVIFPLLLISKYNYPSADDWSYGSMGYKALKNGGNILNVMSAGIKVTWESYQTWEGRFSNSFFASWQPGIWGEKYYGIVAYLMIGILIFSELFLCKCILERYLSNSSKWLCIPIVIPSLILQILYTPSPVESFYWYVGAVNYTFVHGLSLILLATFLMLATDSYPVWKYSLLAFLSSILAILIGGNNFSTSLSLLLALVILSGYFLWKNRKAFFRTWYIPALVGISLIISVAAPGVNARLNANFNGETGNALEAIFNSLKAAFTDICSWTNIKILLMLLLILPFLWKAAKNIQCDLACPPILFTLITFCLYASMFAPNMYVEGSISSGRLGAILYYSYHIWLVGNAGYWVVWLRRRQNKLNLAIKKLETCPEIYLLAYCAVLGIALVGIIYATDLHNISSYRAYRDYRQGWAKQYAKEWDERLKILHDDSIKEVEFAPLSVYPELLLYTDLQTDDGYIWVNKDCAAYYDKTVVRVTAPD